MTGTTTTVGAAPVRGALLGRAVAAANADMERAAIRGLDLDGDERVLEIGIGAGGGVKALMRRLPWGFVAGLDRSEAMVRLAQRRNHRYVRGGLVHVRLGEPTDIPWPDDRFDAVVSIDAPWEPVDEVAGEVRRVLKPDGVLSVVKHASADDDTLTRALWCAGFTSVVAHSRRALRGRMLIVTARA